MTVFGRTFDIHFIAEETRIIIFNFHYSFLIFSSKRSKSVSFLLELVVIINDSWYNQAYIFLISNFDRRFRPNRNITIFVAQKWVRPKKTASYYLLQFLARNSTFDQISHFRKSNIFKNPILSLLETLYRSVTCVYIKTMKPGLEDKGEDQSFRTFRRTDNQNRYSNYDTWNKATRNTKDAVFNRVGNFA